MPEPIAYLNGRFVPAAELCLAVTDAGFVQGATIAEQLRSFGGQLFRWEQHLERLRHSLQLVGLDPGVSLEALEEAARRLVEENHRLLAAGDDLGLSLFITPGQYATFVAEVGPPTVCLHTYPLPFRLWADRYGQDQKLVVADVRQVPADCWPSELKCRSRMHYYLADRQAAQREPGARALLLDHDGCVTEASTANLVIYRRDEGTISPPREKILPGVSMSVVEQLCRDLEIPFSSRPLKVEDILRADEAWLSSTSPCILPAVSLNGQPIGNGQPGRMVQRLLDAWSRLVGIDIVAQAQRFSRR